MTGRAVGYAKHRSVNFVNRYRWVLLKLDLCSITVILRPRVFLIPACCKPTETFANVATILFIRAANQLHLCGVATQREEKKKEEKKEKNDEREVKKTLRIFRRVPMQFVSHFISGHKRSRTPFPASRTPLSVPPMRRVCKLARFIPVERRQPGLFRSSLPLKLAKEIIVARHDFIHGRRREERRGKERPGCDATTSFKYHGKQGPQ